MNQSFPRHFEYPVKVRGTECDSRDRLFPHELLSMAQEAADGHVQSWGYDQKALQKRGLCWMISAITGFLPGELPAWRDQLRILTWCREVRGVRFRREHLFLREREERPFGHLCSDWIVLTDTTHRPLGASSVIAENDRDFFSANGSFSGEKAARLDSLSGAEKEQAERSEVRVLYEDVDRNRHANNCRYLAYCLDAIQRFLLSRGQRLDNLRLLRFDLNYVAEIMENEAFDLFLMKKEEGSEDLLPTGIFPEMPEELLVFYLEGEKKNGTQCFRSRLCYAVDEKGEALE